MTVFKKTIRKSIFQRQHLNAAWQFYIFDGDLRLSELRVPTSQSREWVVTGDPEIQKPNKKRKKKDKKPKKKKKKKRKGWSSLTLEMFRTNTTINKTIWLVLFSQQHYYSFSSLFRLFASLFHFQSLEPLLSFLFNLTSHHLLLLLLLLQSFSETVRTAEFSMRV